MLHCPSTARSPKQLLRSRILHTLAPIIIVVRIADKKRKGVTSYVFFIILLFLPPAYLQTLSSTFCSLTL